MRDKSYSVGNHLSAGSR